MSDPKIYPRRHCRRALDERDEAVRFLKSPFAKRDVEARPFDFGVADNAETYGFDGCLGRHRAGAWVCPVQD